MVIILKNRTLVNKGTKNVTVKPPILQQGSLKRFFVQQEHFQNSKNQLKRGSQQDAKEQT